MSIRLPLAQFTFVDSGYGAGAASVNGGDAFTFTLPQDTDNVVVKFTASVTGGGVSATFQTTDDGGTTWYDVARTSTVSNARNANAEWLSIPVISNGIGSAPVTSVVFTGSVVAVNRTIGSAAASTLGSGQISGLPILSQFNRIFVIATGNVSATSLIQATVKANSQSATA
jgi:hypothetical protein